MLFNGYIDTFEPKLTKVVIEASNEEKAYELLKDRAKLIQSVEGKSIKEITILDFRPDITE